MKSTTDWNASLKNIIAYKLTTVTFYSPLSFSAGIVCTVDSLLTETSTRQTPVKWTLRVGPCLSLLPLFDSL